MKIKSILALVLILSFTLASCADISGSNNTGEDPNGAGSEIVEESGSNPGGGSEDDKLQDEDEKLPDETEGITVDGEKNADLILANRKFSWEIFKKINDEDSNKDIFISPLSISTMLTMAF